MITLKIFYRSIIISNFLILSLLSAIAQQFSNPANETFNSHNYISYLANLSTVLMPCQQGASIPFDKLTMVVVALDKTQGWTQASGKQVRDLLAKDAMANERLLALHALLDGDVKPIVAIYQQQRTTIIIPPGTASTPASATTPAGEITPPLHETQLAIQMLREQGYPVAANVLRTLQRDLTEQRIIAWVSLPPAQRAPIDAYMLERYHPKGQNRRAMVKIALQFFLKPPEQCTIDPKVFYELALLFGKDTGLLNLQLAHQWIHAGKQAEAKKLLLSLLAQSSIDFILPQQAAQMLLSAHDPYGAAEIDHLALSSISEPYAREVRLNYLEFLQQMGEAGAQSVAKDSLTARERKPTASNTSAELPAQMLMSADACLCDKQYARAAAQYAALLQNPSPAISVDARLAAWAGLLDSDPGAGLDAAGRVCALLEKEDPATRAPQLRWCGWQLDRLAGRELPLAADAFSFPTRLAFRPVHEVAGWQTKVAALLDRLLAIDTPALLQPDPCRYNASLRVSAALIYTLAQRGEDAYQAISRRIDYDIPPPPGGWTIFDGTPDAHADQPRHASSPPLGSSEYALSSLTDAIARYQQATMKDNTPSALGLPLSTAAVQQLCAALASEHDPEKITAHLHELAIAVKLAVISLDPAPAVQHLNLPPPAVRPVDVARFAPIEQSIRAALRNDVVARQAHPLLQDGLLASLLIASNPHFTDTLFALLSDTLARYAAVTPEQKTIAYEVHHLAAALAGRPIYDMKPYAEKLREPYWGGSKN